MWTASKYLPVALLAIVVACHGSAKASIQAAKGYGSLQLVVPATPAALQTPSDDHNAFITTFDPPVPIAAYRVTLKVIRFTANTPREKGLRQIRAQGLRPANIRELEAYGSKFLYSVIPKNAIDHPIIALGSPVTRYFTRNDEHPQIVVPTLSGDALGTGFDFVDNPKIFSRHDILLVADVSDKK